MISRDGHLKIVGIDGTLAAAGTVGVAI